MKKMAALILAALFLLSSFSSCSIVEVSVEQLMRAPEHAGDHKEMIEALENYTGREYTLVYPDSEKQFSPVITFDKGNKAAVFFKDKYHTVHAAYLEKDGEWICRSDTALTVEQVGDVALEHFKNDGSIVVFGQNQKGGQLIVLSCTDRLKVLKTVDCFEHIIDDFDGDEQNELVTVSETEIGCFDITDKVNAISKIGFTMQENSQLTVISGNLFDQTKALFIETAQDDILKTDVIYLKNGELMRALSSDDKSAQRKDGSVCRDIDADGYIEVPFSSLMRGYTEDSSNACYITSYKNYDGSEFKSKITGDFDYDNGYYLSFPEEWLENVTVEYDKNNRMRSYRIFDTATGKAAGFLVKSKVYTAEEFARIDQTNVLTLYNGGDTVYAARIVNRLNRYAVDEEQLKNMFGLIK